MKVTGINGKEYVWNLNGYSVAANDKRKKVEVSHSSKKSSEGNFPLVQDTRGSQTTGKHGVSQKGCSF